MLRTYDVDWELRRKSDHRPVCCGAFRKSLQPDIHIDTYISCASNTELLTLSGIDSNDEFDDENEYTFLYTTTEVED